MTTSPEDPTPVPASGTPQVVFACVRNGGRSVISRVLTEHYAGGRVLALSAGTQTGEHIHPEVADVLGRLGLDTSQEQPKLLTRETIAASTMAITLGCGEECPYVPGVNCIGWPVDDPGGQDEATVHRIIADLDHRVRTPAHRARSRHRPAAVRTHPLTSCGSTTSTAQERDFVDGSRENLSTLPPPRACTPISALATRPGTEADEGAQTGARTNEPSTTPVDAHRARQRRDQRWPRLVLRDSSTPTSRWRSGTSRVPYARNVKDSAVVAAVIVIDMQRAFAEGPGAIPRIGTVLQAAQRQIEAAHAAGALVVFLQNDGGPGEPDQPGSTGWELAFEPQPGDAVMRKRHDNGFAGTDLDAVLREHHVNKISICGVMSEMCVAATARSAMERGYEVVLAHDAHGTYRVPALTNGEPEVPAALAARVAEWSLGDDVLIPLTSESVRFLPAIPEDPRDDAT